MQSAKDYMHLVDGTINLLKEIPDAITYVLNSAATMKNYTFTLPVIAGYNNTCVLNAGIHIQVQKPNPISRLHYGKKIQPLSKHFDSHKGTRSKVLSEYTRIPTSDSVLSYGFYKYRGLTLGIIHLASFEPDDSNFYNTVELIRGLLVGPLQYADALIFDMRSNPGGIIEFAEAIPQLFAGGKYNPTVFNNTVVVSTTNSIVIQNYYRNSQYDQNDPTEARYII